MPKKIIEKDARLEIRINSNVKAMLQERAKMAGLSLADLFVQSASKSEVVLAYSNRKLLLAEVSRIGNNLNQLVTTLHSIGELPTDDQLDKLIAEFKAIKDSLR